MNSSTKIKSIHARQVMDCRFRPAVEVDVTLENGAVGRGSASAGISAGQYEAYTLRDNDPDRFCGLSVFQAIDNIHHIIVPAIYGMDVLDQGTIDRCMIDLDGTTNKSKLGGNAIYSVSVACMQAAAKAHNLDLYQYIAGEKLKTLPLPMANSISGGKYPDRTVCFQEFTICPYKAETITEALEIIIDVHHAIGQMFTIEQNGEPALRGNGHGWLPPTEDPAEIIQLMDEAVKRCGYTDKVAYALDVAASKMYDPRTGTYYINGKLLTADEQIAYIKGLTEQYNFLFIEDVLDRNDWDGYVRASKVIDRTILIGDDITITSLKCLQKAHQTGAVQGFVFKPSQIGTVTEAIEARRFAKEKGILTIPSQYKGGTIWDVEVEACKSCAPCGGEGVYAMNSIYRAAEENLDAKLFDFSSMVRF